MIGGRKTFEYFLSPLKNNIDIKYSVIALWWTICNDRNDVFLRGKVINPHQIFKYARSLHSSTIPSRKTQLILLLLIFRIY